MGKISTSRDWEECPLYKEGHSWRNRNIQDMLGSWPGPHVTGAKDLCEVKKIRLEKWTWARPLRILDATGRS
jgi:hypothetical protein